MSEGRTSDFPGEFSGISGRSAVSFFPSLRRQFRAPIKRAGPVERRSRLNFGKYIRFYSAGKIFLTPPHLFTGRREHVSLSGERWPRGAAMDVRADLRNIRETRRRNNFPGCAGTRVK